MFKIKFLSILIIMTLFLIYPVNAKTANITVSEDAYVNETSPDMNYGNNSHVYSLWGNGNNKEPFMKFNVPAHTTHAILHIYTDGGFKNGQNVTVVKTSSSWNENNITWNNKPIDIGFIYGATANMGFNNRKWVQFNVTSGINNSISPEFNSFRLRGDWGCNDNWVSKENESYAPYLEVTAFENISTTVASFTSNITSGNVPLTVQFNDTSTNSPTAWNWNFGDGDTSTEQNPTHTYSTAETYTVNLTVSNANGTSSTTAAINVTSKVLPVANFSTNVTEGYAPFSVQFTDISTNATGWNWDFGDRANSIEQNPTHTYLVAGNYTVSLQATNTEGSNSTTRSNYIQVNNCTQVNYTTMNITASEDSYINESAKDTTYGDVAQLKSGWGSLSAYPLIKFQTTAYAGEAYLHVYEITGYKDSTCTLTAFRTTNDWDEDTVTWNNPPGTIDSNMISSSEALPSNRRWVTINVSSVVKDPSNYSFKLRPSWGHDDVLASKENTSYAPYLEIHTATPPTDINWNSKTNNNSKAFLVTPGETVKFGILAQDLANCTWSVNKTVQTGTSSEFNFKVPSFNASNPSTGIWEIRADGYYTNGSRVVREWLISGLTENQAPDIIDSFIDLDNRYRSGYIKDPWGREFPYYYSPGTNLISQGYDTGGDLGSGTALEADSNMIYGTYKYRVNGNHSLNQVGFDSYDINGNHINSIFTTGDNHDYFSIGHKSYGSYIPIARQAIGQAPGHYTLRSDGWHNVTVVYTKDGWISRWIDDQLIPTNCLYVGNLLENGSYFRLTASSWTMLDNVEFYKDKCIYPPTDITYGPYAKYWTPDYPCNDPVLDNGIIVFGRGLTLKQICNTINSNSLITYNDSTKTATLKTNLFIKAGAELNITDETLVVDTSNGSKFIALYPFVMFRVKNSTITTNGDNPLIWDIASSVTMDCQEQGLIDHDDNLYSVTKIPQWSYKGSFIAENSTINNTCNLFLDGAAEVILNDTVFSNMSKMDFGSNAHMGAQAYYNYKKDQANGNKSFWFVPRDDIATYSIKNVSFVNPKVPIDFKIVGGEFQFNDTTIKDCDLSNINISTKKAWKYVEFNWYRQPWENSSVALLNCKYNESNFSLETNNTKIKAKYYADIVVKDPNGNPIQNALLDFTASDSRFPAENLYSYKTPVDDGLYGPGIGGSGSYGPPNYAEPYPTNYYTYHGGWFFRWFNALPFSNTSTNFNGRTALPSEDVNETIILIDNVFTNETGVLSKESIRYNLTINPPNSKSFYIKDLDPDSTWYRKDSLVSEYTITAIVPDNSSKGPHITGFAPSTDNPFDPGEKKIFRVWTYGNLTGMNWTVDGKHIANETLNYTWNVTGGNHIIEFSGYDADINVSHVWNIGEKSGDNTPIDNNQTAIAEFLPESALLTKNTGESVTFKVVSDQLLDSKWSINGELARSGTASITQGWSTPGIYNVTFSGSIGGEPILHTWTVDVIDSPESQSDSIVRVAPEYQIVSPGKTFALDIWTDPCTAITGTQFDLFFNDSMVKVGTVKEGNLFSQNGASTYFSNGIVNSGAGVISHIYGSILGESNVSSPGTVAVINLTASNSTGVAEFNLSNVIISDINSSRLSNIINNSTVLIDTAPDLNLIGFKSVNEMENLTFKISAKDADGNNLAFSASGLPSGANFDPVAAVFTWTPSKGQAGVYTVAFKVSDGYLNNSEDVEITVIPLNNAPSIVSFEPANGSIFNEGENITIALNSSDADNQALSYIIKVDGTVYSTSPSYVWNTNYSSSGSHTLELTVSDGIEEVKRVNTIYINDVHPRWDVNKDGVVDIRDVTMVSKKYGTITKAPYPSWDVNKDGIVDMEDLNLVRSHFGEKVE